LKSYFTSGKLPTDLIEILDTLSSFIHQTVHLMEEKLSQAKKLQEKITELETSACFLSQADINSIQEKTLQKVQVSISPTFYKQLF